ncbi:MAG TPA: response regulator, partial [Phycisphaerales bacterium]|nr:response regulator [Phycisphaerales bacterium]
MPKPESRPRILCLDDDADVCRAFVRTFRGRYEVTTAVAAEEA